MALDADTVRLAKGKNLAINTAKSRQCADQGRLPGMGLGGRAAGPHPSLAAAICWPPDRNHAQLHPLRIRHG